MPLYTFVCREGHRDQIFAKIADRDSPRTCLCGGPLTRIIEAPSIRPDIPAYQSPVTGEWVNSRAQRREDLLRTGSMEWEPGLRQELAKRRAEKFEEALKPFEKGVEDVARAMVASGDIPPI